MADLGVEFSTNVNDDFINTITSIILQNMMENNNSVVIDGVNYPAAVDMIFEGDVPQMNGTLISAANVTACVYIIYSRVTLFLRLLSCTIFAQSQQLGYCLQ